MSVDIKFDDVGVVFTLEGEFSYDGVRKAHEDLFGNEKFKTIRYLIVDRRNSVNYNMTSQQVEELSLLCLNAARDNKKLIEILIADDDLQFGMSRQFQAFAEGTGWNIIALRNMESAKRLLKELLSS